MRPQDRNPTTAAPGKPFTPTVSTTAVQGSKTPLTPKLAGYNPSTTHHPPPKHARSDSLIAEPSSSPVVSTPPSSFLNANITPRSGPRRARQDVLSSPVSDSPTPAQHAPRAPFYSATGSSQPEPILRDGQRSLRGIKGITNGSLLHPPASQPVSSSGSSVGSPKFFHADDTRPNLSRYPEESSDAGDYSRKPGSITKRQAAGYGIPLAKAPETPPSRLDLRPPNSSSGDPTPVERGHLRRTSQSSSLHDSNVPHLPYSASFHGRSPLSPQSPVKSLHVRSISTDVSHPPARISHLPLANFGHPATSPDSDHTSQTNPTSPSIGTQLDGPGPSPPSELAHPFPRAPSPSKEDTQPGSNGVVYKMSQTSASARHERKVMDLEISNSSLLAINRALERELRKQTAELRRFRRLSRSGRLSMNPSYHPASRRLSGVSESVDDEDGTHSPVDTPADLSDSEEEDDDPSSLASEEGSTSPSSSADQDASHRARDEKRFLLDLSKHQELLLGSQRMNQSIKRCLGWTENLISEAKKALEYKVHVSEIEIGGRVLRPDEVGAELQGGRALLSPTADLPPLPDSNDIFELMFSDIEDD